MEANEHRLAESPRHPYTVLEPEEEPEAASERSTSIDGSEGVKFSMQEMEGYMAVLQQDRDALKKEVERLQQGLGALFEAMKKPTAEMMQLQTEQIGLVSAAERFEATKAEVASSISQLTVKCSKMDQAMPELRDKLEHVVNMITSFQENFAGPHGSQASQASPALSDHSTSPSAARARTMSPADSGGKCSTALDRLRAEFERLSAGLSRLRAHASVSEGEDRQRELRRRTNKVMDTYPVALSGASGISAALAAYTGRAAGAGRDRVVAVKLSDLVQAVGGGSKRHAAATASASEPLANTPASPAKQALNGASSAVRSRAAARPTAATPTGGAARAAARPVSASRRVPAIGSHQIDLNDDSGQLGAPRGRKSMTQSRMASRESVERGRSGLAPANAAAAAALGVGATSRVPTAAATTPTLTATRAARARTAPHRASASAAAASPAPAATPTGVPAPRRSASGGVRTSRESIDRLSRPKSVHSAAPDYPYKGATLRRTTSAHSSGPPSPTPAAPRSAARGPQPSKSPTSALPASRRRAATATGRPSRLSLPGGPRAAADTDLRAAASLDVDRGEPSELTQELTTEQSFMSDITAPLDSIREQHSRASSLYDDLSLDGASALPSPRPSPTRSAHTTVSRGLAPMDSRSDTVSPGPPTPTDATATSSMRPLAASPGTPGSDGRPRRQRSFAGGDASPASVQRLDFSVVASGSTARGGRDVGDIAVAAWLQADGAATGAPNRSKSSPRLATAAARSPGPTPRMPGAADAASGATENSSPGSAADAVESSSSGESAASAGAPPSFADAGPRAGGSDDEVRASRRRSLGPALSTVPEEASVISKGESQSEMPAPTHPTTTRAWLAAGPQKENGGGGSGVGHYSYRPPARMSVTPYDNFSIDSKDSCKPEKCDSPHKSRHRGTRNGQGTSAEPAARRHMVLSAHSRDNLRTVATAAVTEGERNEERMP